VAAGNRGTGIAASRGDGPAAGWSGLAGIGSSQDNI